MGGIDLCTDQTLNEVLGPLRENIASPCSHAYPSKTQSVSSSDSTTTDEDDEQRKKYWEQQAEEEEEASRDTSEISEDSMTTTEPSSTVQINGNSILAMMKKRNHKSQKIDYHNISLSVVNMV